MELRQKRRKGSSSERTNQKGDSPNPIESKSEVYSRRSPTWLFNLKVAYWVAWFSFRRRIAELGQRLNRLRRTPAPIWKRLVDMAIPFLLMPILLPVFLVVGGWIKLTSRGPVFFRQYRVGLNGEPFAFYKFRSMKIDGGTRVHEKHFAYLVKSNKPMVKLDELGDKRLIPGGALLRSTGIDELPQLINVLRGDMSLVGPRPCTPKEFELYGAEQKRRFEALPGITGYWQVKGKNGTTFVQMLEMDEFYIENFRLALDLLIILRTPAILFLQLIDVIEMRICESAASRHRKAN